MTRRIYCPACARDRDLCPEDRDSGFKSRRNEILLGPVPIGHGVTIKEQGKPDEERLMSSIHCDLCNATVPMGGKAVAVTTWNKNREGEPGLWEAWFGEIM